MLEQGAEGGAPLYYVENPDAWEQLLQDAAGANF